MTKPTTKDQSNSLETFKREIVNKVKVLGPIAQKNRRNIAESSRKNPHTLSRNAASSTANNLKQAKKVKAESIALVSQNQTVALTVRKGDPYVPDLIVIGSSTGGPQALFHLIKDIDRKVTQPILIVQHMPPTFTTILAEHMEKTRSSNS